MSAFPAGGPVKIQTDNNELAMVIANDDIGISAGSHWKNNQTLELQTVCSLVENRLNGSIGLDTTISG